VNVTKKTNTFCKLAKTPKKVKEDELLLKKEEDVGSWKIRK